MGHFGQVDNLAVPVVSVRTENPLAYAVGFLAGAIVADLLLIGADAFAYVMHWRGLRR